MSILIFRQYLVCDSVNFPGKLTEWQYGDNGNALLVISETDRMVPLNIVIFPPLDIRDYCELGKLDIYIQLYTNIALLSWWASVRF